MSATAGTRSWSSSTSIRINSISPLTSFMAFSMASADNTSMTNGSLKSSTSSSPVYRSFSTPFSTNAFPLHPICRSLRPVPTISKVDQIFTPTFYDSRYSPWKGIISIQAQLLEMVLLGIPTKYTLLGHRYLHLRACITLSRRISTWVPRVRYDHLRRCHHHQQFQNRNLTLHCNLLP